VVKDALEAAGFTEYAQQWQQLVEHATTELRRLEGAVILQVMGVVRGALQALDKGEVRSALDDIVAKQSSRKATMLTTW
jgi:hypothetical protein